MSTATTNLYVQPFLRVEKRREWINFISNQTIFDPALIYQPNDPNFGVQSRLKMTVEFGIQQLNLADYTPALTRLYRKRLYFGDVKVAQARDVDANYIYDAVYLDVIDNLKGVNAQVVSTVTNTAYYPNSIDNMRNSLSSITLQDNSNISVSYTHLTLPTNREV